MIRRGVVVVWSYRLIVRRTRVVDGCCGCGIPGREVLTLAVASLGRVERHGGVGGTVVGTPVLPRRQGWAGRLTLTSSSSSVDVDVDVESRFGRLVCRVVGGHVVQVLLLQQLLFAQPLKLFLLPEKLFPLLAQHFLEGGGGGGRRGRCY